MGLRNGDKIISVDNEEVEDFLKIIPHVVLEEAATIQVLRDKEHIDIKIPKGSISKLIKQKDPVIWPRTPCEIRDFTKESPGKEAGNIMQSGKFL